MTRAGTRGQGLVEAGIVMVLLVSLAMGIIEFGRAFMIANMITHAARHGARLAALGTSAGTVQTQVLNQIATVVPTTGFAVAVQPTAGPPPTVTVRVTGTVNYIFNLVGTNFAVDRQVTFRDETK